jgi:hypothetical protein
MKVSLLAISFGFLLVLPLAASAGPTSGSDSDGDGVADPFDNCTAVQNADQADADHDGCGDPCDASITCDATGDGGVGIPDFNILLGEFGSTGCTPETCFADCNQDTGVGIPDFNQLVLEFGSTVGPSGVDNPGRDQEACPGP